MPKQSKLKTPYEYNIPPFIGDLDKTGNISPHARDEYFRIESLIRTEKANQAFKKGGKEALKALFRSRGIIDQQPLTNFEVSNSKRRLYLYLQIDISEGPTNIIKNEGLLTLLKKRHDQYKRMPPSNLFPMYHFTGITDWFNYFKCYDLQRMQGLLPEKLARYVYQDDPSHKKSVKRATQAVKRAAQAVKSAHDNTWPPIID